MPASAGDVTRPRTIRARANGEHSHDEAIRPRDRGYRHPLTRSEAVRVSPHRTNDGACAVDGRECSARPHGGLGPGAARRINAVCAVQSQPERGGRSPRAGEVDRLSTPTRWGRRGRWGFCFWYEVRGVRMVSMGEVRVSCYWNCSTRWNI